MDVTCSTHGINEKIVQIFGQKRPLGKPKRTWEDNI
jgi:hypothetical protein